MAFLRNPSKERFTNIDNYSLRDKNLSLKARGLLVSMLSLPDNWEFSENGLEVIFPKDGQASIRSGLKELETHGYLLRERTRDSHGRVSKVIWTVCDYPRLENPSVVNPSVENPNVENPPQLNTNLSNTKELTTNSRKTDREDPKHKYGEYQNVLLSDKDLETLKALFPDYQERIERLSEYMASSGRTYKNHLATIRTWARKDKQSAQRQEEEGNPFLEILREEQERKYGSGRDSEDYVTI